MGLNVRGLGSPLLYNYQYNIQKYKRNGDSTISSQPMEMDSLNYAYVPGTNRLDHIEESVPPGNYMTDIDKQSSGNYVYDSTGNLISDNASGISAIAWTVYGKIASITKGGDSTIRYTYDASGNRVSKSVIHSGDSLTTWYVRDAQGNVLSVYTAGDPALHGRDLTRSELHIYGSSRLGIIRDSTEMQMLAHPDTVTIPLLGLADSVTFTRGNKFFELTNHLGNVLATISDKRFGISTDDSTVNYFIPELVTANDYYPFGSLEPGRSYTKSGTSGYRYGFNGKEKNDEISGPGNTIDFGNRMDDTRGGRWFSIDRITKPWLSPYAYAADNPVNNVDPDGKDEIHFHFYTTSVIGPDGKVMGGPTTFTAEIIKANGPDKFFVHTHSDVIRMPTNYSHGGQATQEKTVEIYPWNPDSRSGFTKSTALGIPVNDRDYATLMKYATANPALKEYIKERSQGYEATNYDKENYKGLLEDLPVYNAIGKIKQRAELTAGILSIVEGGYGLLKAGGIEADISVLSSAGGNSARMSVVRTIAKGEKIDDLMNDLKGLTFTTGNEHAVVTLANGERAIVSGGPGGITFEQGQIRTLFGHTHPTSAPPSSADATALTKLGQSKQYVLHGGEITTVRPK